MWRDDTVMLVNAWRNIVEVAKDYMDYDLELRRSNRFALNADTRLASVINTSWTRMIESAKKSGVGISQAEVSLRPYPSSD